MNISPVKAYLNVRKVVMEALDKENIYIVKEKAFLRLSDNNVTIYKKEKKEE